MGPREKLSATVTNAFAQLRPLTPLGWAGIAAASTLALGVAGLVAQNYRNDSGATEGVAQALTRMNVGGMSEVQLRNSGTHTFTNPSTGEQGRFVVSRPELTSSGQRCYATEMVGGGAGNNATVKDATGKVHKVAIIRTVCPKKP